MSEELPLNEDQIAALGRQVEGERWQLPEKFRLTDEMLKKSDEDQKELGRRSASPFASMSPQDAYRATSVKVAENLRNTLDDLKKRMGPALLGEGPHTIEEIQRAILAVRHQLAERYAAFGRFDLATETEPQEAYRAEYQRILEAIWRDDEETCECGEHRGSGPHTAIAVTQWVPSLDVYSPKHGRIVSLMRCNQCQFMNAIDTPKEAVLMRAHRARARALAGSRHPVDAAAVLNQAGHTSAKLLPKK